MNCRKTKTGVKKSEKSSTVRQFDSSTVRQFDSSTVRQFHAICRILKTVEITGLPNVDQKFSQLLVYLLKLGLIFFKIFYH
jgi:hypothetical protein